MAKGNQHLKIYFSNTMSYLLNLMVLLVLILPFLPIETTTWWLDNLSSLQLQWSVAALVLLAFNIKKAKKYFGMLTVLLITVIYLQRPASYAANTEVLTAPSLKIAQLNIHYQNPHLEPLLSRLNAADFDLLVLQEVGNDQRQKITTLKQAYPYFISDSSNGDLALFSKWPIVEQKIHDLGYQGGHIIEVIIQSPKTNNPVHIFTLHPVSPRNAELWQLRNSTLNYVAEQAFASLLQYKIIVGDLNTTPWSAQFKALQKNSLLTYSDNAFSYIPSWSYSEKNPLLSLLSSAYIDHCLISAAFAVISKDYQRVPGSDHQLLITELGMR
ncbi:MAG: endonuclease/exonuclease/phosphatase (EEP) superfamily protein YafD [Psychromonas sp.]|jgi:endonuclease/exonuclease/phosphatase (EEP) superfamily protein YafD|uniref:endonuclease/exonuclease/phosphatase family protein n=1 Tax=Psychromonas sp. TaxID=1884585 RepID=UPI0039E728F0